MVETNKINKGENMRDGNQNGFNFKKGDMLNSTWGYGQTNQSWYKVIKETDKTVTLQEYHGIRVKVDEMNFMAGTEAPGTKKYGKPFRKTKKMYMSPKPYMGCLEIWDGEPKFASHWN